MARWDIELTSKNVDDDLNPTQTEGYKVSPSSTLAVHELIVSGRANQDGSGASCSRSGALIGLPSIRG